MKRKWQSEEEMNAELRRIADETRRLRDEMRAYLPHSPKPRRTPELPTDEDRRLRPLDDEDEEE